MEILILFIRLIFYLSLALMLIGLWRPWIVLWWRAYQNRLAVLKLYGCLSLFSALLLWLLSF